MRAGASLRTVLIEMKLLGWRLGFEATEGKLSETKAMSNGTKKKAIALDTTQPHVMIHQKERENKREKINGRRPFFSALRKHASRPSGVTHESFRKKVT